MNIDDLFTTDDRLCTIHVFSNSSYNAVNVVMFCYCKSNNRVFVSFHIVNSIKDDSFTGCSPRTVIKFFIFFYHIFLLLTVYSVL